MAGEFQLEDLGRQLEPIIVCRTVMPPPPPAA